MINKINFKKLLGSFAVVGLALGLAGCASQASGDAANSKNSQSQSVKPLTLKATPTLFFHGWGSSAHAEDQMAQAAVKAGKADKIIRANVSSKGKVTLVGRIPASSKHPIVEVNYNDNKNANYHEAGQWAKNVVVKLQQQYRIKDFNMVGHSMGNMAIAYYLLDNAKDNKLPKLRKQVDIAGHFNGILGMNDKPNRMKLTKAGRPTKPDSDYKELLGLRKTYPKNQIKVLNIYGDKNDGTHSDGDVSNASSQSLRYLVAGRAKSYREVKIVGAQAQHSKLHENQQVDRILINFLWS